jgi:hypothetical protein
MVIYFATVGNLLPTEPAFAQANRFMQQYPWYRRPAKKNVYFDSSSGFISITIRPACEGLDFYA